jgi:hypothetical protein
MRFRIVARSRQKPNPFLIRTADGQLHRNLMQHIPMHLKVGDTGVFYVDERGRQRIKLDAIEVE